MTQSPRQRRMIDTIWTLFEESGVIPRQREILLAAGGGSMRDVNAAFKEWHQELADLVHETRHQPGIPDEISESIRNLWKRALEDGRKIADQSWEKDRKEMATQVETLQSELEERVTLLDETRERLETREQELQDRTEALQELEEANRQLQAQVQQTDKTRKQLIAEKQRLENELQSLTIRLDETRKDLLDQIRHLQTEHERNREDWKEQLSHEQKMQKELELKIDTLNNQLLRTHEDLAGRKAELKVLRAALEARERDCQGLAKDKENLDRELVRAQDRLSTARSKTARLEEAIEEWKKRYREEKDARIQQEKETALLQQQIRQLERALSSKNKGVKKDG